MENKRGQLWLVALVIGSLLILILTVTGLTVGWSIVKTATDEIIPEFNSIGEVAPGINVSEYSTKATTPLDAIISNMGLIMGLLYIIGITGLLAMSFVFRDDRSGWVIALFVVCVLVLIIVCIAMSQFYEEFYLSQDELGANLREAPLVSKLIIHSPTIMTIVAFICGVILFSGTNYNRGQYA